MTKPLDIFSGFCVFVVAVQVLCKVCPWLYQNFIGPKLLGSRVDFKKMGKWALVTGATDGIGKSYAHALALKGLNVVLVSRTQSKLEDVAKEIETMYSVETKIIVIDFCSSVDIYEKIEREVQGLEIGVLINNVGLSYANPEYYLDLPNRDKMISDIVTCNIVSVTNMCKMILPGMVDRGRGIVINISSLSAVIPAPMLTVYAASKAFVDKFSDDLNVEYAKKGIIVQSVLPGPVATNMSKIKKSTWMATTPQRFVDSALKTVGFACHTTGYYPHSLLQLSIDTLNFFTASRARKMTLNVMENIRMRAARKNAKQ